MNRLAQQWQLLEMIQHSTGIAVDDVARNRCRLDRTVRTIWRNLSALKKAGYLYDEGAGRRLLWKLESLLGLPVQVSLAQTAALGRSGSAPGGPETTPEQVF